MNYSFLLAFRWKWLFTILSASQTSSRTIGHRWWLFSSKEGVYAEYACFLLYMDTNKSPTLICGLLCATYCRDYDGACNGKKKGLLNLNAAWMLNWPGPPPKTGDESASTLNGMLFTMRARCCEMRARANDFLFVWFNGPVWIVLLLLDDDTRRLK